MYLDENEVGKFVNLIIADANQQEFYFQIDMTNEIIDNLYYKINITDCFYDFRNVSADITLDENDESSKENIIMNIDLPVQDFSLYFDKNENKLFLPKVIKFTPERIANIYIEFDKMKNGKKLLEQYDESQIKNMINDQLSPSDLNNIDLNQLYAEAYGKYFEN